MALLPVKFKCHVYWEEDEVPTGRKVQKAAIQRVEFKLDLATGSLLTRLADLAMSKPPTKLEVIGSNDEVEVFCNPDYHDGKQGPDSHWSYRGAGASALVVWNT